MENILPSKVSSKTATTGAVGGVSGVGLAPLIIWILGQFGIDMLPEFAAMVGGLIAGVASTVIAWVVPAKSGKYVDTEPWILEPSEPAEEVLDWDVDRDGRMVDFADNDTPALEEDEVQV